MADLDRLFDETPPLRSARPRSRDGALARMRTSRCRYQASTSRRAVGSPAPSATAASSSSAAPPPPPAAEGPPRPRNRPWNTTLCEYCNTWQKSCHRMVCSRAPFELWAEHTRKSNQQGGEEQLTALTPRFCEFCMIGFHDSRPYGLHLFHCNKKRIACSLPIVRAFGAGQTPSREYLRVNGVPEVHLLALFGVAVPSTD